MQVQRGRVNRGVRLPRMVLRVARPIVRLTLRRTDLQMERQTDMQVDMQADMQAVGLMERRVVRAMPEKVLPSGSDDAVTRQVVEAS